MRKRIESYARLSRGAVTAGMNRLLGKSAAAAPEPHFELFGEAEPCEGSIPKIVWIYWHQDQMPASVSMCLANTKRLNPGYDIRLLGPDTVGRYVPEIPQQLDHVNVEKRADWIRLYLMQAYGGIWLDSTIFLTEPLDWIQATQALHRSEAVGFYIQSPTYRKEHPVIENWFLSSVPGSRFMREWFEVFHEKVILGGTTDYLQGLKRRGVYETILQGITSPEYLTMHIAGQEVIQEMGPHRLSLARAEDSAFFYHERAGWNVKRLHRELLFKPMGARVPLLVKLRGADRRYLDRYLTAGIYLRDSVLGRLLKP